MTGAVPKTDPRERYRVPILDRTLDLLELLAERTGGLTLTEMTEALAVPKNTVFRIATTLVLRGYAERTRPRRATGSREACSARHHALGGEDLVRLAAPVLARLRDESGETALLGTLSGTGASSSTRCPPPNR